jgi:hypothetical protein
MPDGQLGLNRMDFFGGPMGEKEDGVSRSEFLRGSAIGAAGLPFATLLAPGPLHDASGYVVAVTHGPSDANRVMLALFMATRLPAGDNHVWFAIDGGPLCKKGEAEKVTSPLFTAQGNAGKLLAQARERGAAIHI